MKEAPVPTTLEEPLHELLAGLEAKIFTTVLVGTELDVGTGIKSTLTLRVRVAFGPTGQEQQDIRLPSVDE